MLENIKVALVHDFLNQYGGAERVLLALHEMFPEAPIYALLHDPKKMRGKFKDADVRVSFLRKFPKFLQKRHKWLLPFMPTAPETFNLRDYALVISSSSAFAKGIVVKPKTLHICYCHSPMRFVWDWNEKYLAEQGFGKRKKFFGRMLLNYVRMWDQVASHRVDYFIANSKTTQERIKKYYRRDSTVVYPPVEIGDCKETKAPIGALVSKDYFLIVSRLAPYKKIDIAIEAMNKLNLPLVIVGEGSDKYIKYLKKIAGPKTKFAGWKKDEELKKYYKQARAFLFPGEDDFGITPVEAMAQGTPVLALRKGGATETIIEGETGEFFDDPTIESMADGVRRFMARESEYDIEKIKEQARKFSKDIFMERIKKVIEEKMKE
ncbi:MAG: glycosyltransferase [Candidatus Moranbacteria bacterium]|nr:glycosyltransferase [Candidatus Moranbacteria bacterium]